jgi:hypothetical protein
MEDAKCDITLRLHVITSTCAVMPWDKSHYLFLVPRKARHS